MVLFPETGTEMALTLEEERLRLHCQIVVEKFKTGRIVPFLGAGANLCNRPKNYQWLSTQETYLPSGSELASELAKKFFYPQPLVPCPSNLADCSGLKKDLDLAQVSQFGELTQGPGQLYEELQGLFARGYLPTELHHFLSNIGPAECGDNRPENKHLLIVTTNYDDLMEQALESHDYDLLFYDPEDLPGRFWHRRPGKAPIKITDPSKYNFELCGNRPAVLKIHGTIDRSNKGHEGFVITEDHYIKYLAEEPLEKLLPPTVLVKLRANNLLFMGYSLRDWNLRVFLHRLKRNPRKNYKSWAIVWRCDAIAMKFWESNDVEIFDMELDKYIQAVKEASAI
jgi:hypothetical protein